MKKTQGSIWVGIALIAIASIYSAYPQNTVSPQSLQSRVIKKISYKNEPISLNSVKLKDKVVFLDQDFMSTDDWLKDFSVEITNNTDRKIMAIELTLLVKNIKGREAPTGLPIRYNNLVDSQKGLFANPPIKSGESAQMGLTDTMFETLNKRVLEKDTWANINTAYLVISNVLFEDNTLWVAGHINNPNKEKTGWSAKAINLNFSSINQKPDQKTDGILKKAKPQLCYCGGTDTKYELCCLNSETGCSAHYFHATIDCNLTGNYRCESFEGPDCGCFPGACLQCLFISCEIN